MAATLALSAESFVGRAEMVTGSYEISTGAYVETLHGARTVPTAEGARATNPRGGNKGLRRPCSRASWRSRHCELCTCKLNIDIPLGAI